MDPHKHYHLALSDIRATADRLLLAQPGMRGQFLLQLFAYVVSQAGEDTDSTMALMEAIAGGTVYPPATQAPEQSGLYRAAQALLDEWDQAAPNLRLAAAKAADQDREQDRRENEILGSITERHAEQLRAVLESPEAATAREFAEAPDPGKWLSGKLTRFLREWHVHYREALARKAVAITMGRMAQREYQEGRAEIIAVMTNELGGFLARYARAEDHPIQQIEMELLAAPADPPPLRAYNYPPDMGMLIPDSAVSATLLENLSAKGVLDLLRKLVETFKARADSAGRSAVRLLGAEETIGHAVADARCGVYAEAANELTTILDGGPDLAAPDPQPATMTLFDEGVMKALSRRFAGTTISTRFEALVDDLRRFAQDADAESLRNKAGGGTGYVIFDARRQALEFAAQLIEEILSDCIRRGGRA